jgi:phosphopantothenoylcysteine decarboxylase / phosphopantothenate---cysteine ligase
MGPLAKKHIITGITGGIAAYKAAYLVRLFVKAGAEVKVLMTTFAKEFISSLTLATLSGHPVMTEFYNPENGDWNSHVDLGIWADGFVIAPATANTIAKMAHGVADNLLLTTYLSARCPVFVAPAMDFDMYKHPATLENIAILEKHGCTIIAPSSGELASGLSGEGRLQEPDEIFDRFLHFFQQSEDFLGKRVLITAGPTHEPIDPVRYIGNYSTGKMGYAIAEELAKRGAEVQLISGPVNLSVIHQNISIIKVTTANEMHEQSVNRFTNCDIAVMAAAVADFTPCIRESEKIKKTSDNLTIELTPTKDIAFELGRMKKSQQLLIGFALETENELENARSKVKNKNLDAIVLNSLRDKGAGFMHDTNKITIIDRDNNIKNYELKTKNEVACDIVNEIKQYLTKKN